jgi:predicted nucleotidyltransferase
VPFAVLLERKEAIRRQRQADTLAVVEACCRRFAREFPCRRLWIFGSVVGGRFHGQSDIDIAVEGLPEDLFFKGLAYLMRCLPPEHAVDLKPFESLDPALKRRVEREGMLLAG